MPRITAQDRGAASVLVTILLAGGVLLGMTAMSVDVGQLYAEREELQSGADAGAMAIALDCAKVDSPSHDAACQAFLNSAEAYADPNAKDGASKVTYVCGTDIRLPSCTAGSLTGNLADCVGERAAAPAGATWVEVRTQTEMSGGDYLLPFSFAQTLTGVPSGATVMACSRVGWGAPNGGFALTFSVCEYDAAVANGDFVTGIPDAGDEVVLYTHGHSDANECNEGPSGANLPGGFGWTGHNSDCVTTIDPDGSYDSDPGNDTPGDCKDDLTQLVDSRQAVGIPIFEDLGGQGANAYYVLKGFAAFVVTGYHLPGMQPKSRPSWLTGNSWCNGNENCVYGYFTNGLVEWDGSFGTHPSLGATVVKTIG